MEEGTQTSLAVIGNESPEEPGIRITLPAATNGEVSIERFGKDLTSPAKLHDNSQAAHSSLGMIGSSAQPVDKHGPMSRMVVHLDPYTSVMGSSAIVPGMPARVMVTVEFSDRLMGSYHQDFNPLSSKRQPQEVGGRQDVDTNDAAVSARKSCEAVTGDESMTIIIITFVIH
jgi:hypothetical protein